MLGKGFTSTTYPCTAEPCPACGTTGKATCRAWLGTTGELQSRLINGAKHPSPALPLPAAKGGGVVPSHAGQRLYQQTPPVVPSHARQGLYQQTPPVVPSHARQGLYQQTLAVVPSHARHAASPGRPLAEHGSALREGFEAGRSTAESTPPRPSPCLRQREGADCRPLKQQRAALGCPCGTRMLATLNSAAVPSPR